MEMARWRTRSSFLLASYLAVLGLLSGCSDLLPRQSEPTNRATAKPSPTEDTVEQENLVFDCIRYQNGFYEGLPGSALRPWESFLLGEWHGFTGNPTLTGNYYPNNIRSKAFSNKWEEIVNLAGRENYPDLFSSATEFQVLCLVTANVQLEIQ